MADHFRKQCKHGTLASTCRCPSRDKPIQIVPCPAHCTVQEYTPKHAKLEES